MSKNMKFDELNKYIVKCKRTANIDDDVTRYPSGDEEQNLSELKEELKNLFESRENVDIEDVKRYLQSVFIDFINVEPIA